MNSFLQIFFCKPPVAGRVKTRLGRFLGMERARDLYAALCRRVVGSFPGERVRLFSETGEHIQTLSELFPAGVPGEEIQIQAGHTLGEKMADALFRVATSPGTPAGIDRLLLTGTDIPDYSLDVATIIAKLLDENDVALGPTPDGGYYCVAARIEVARDRELLARLFAEIPWSTPEVFVLQKQRVETAGLKFGLGPELPDLDDFDDLARWRAGRATAGDARDKSHGDDLRSELDEFFPDIRVVLPIYNEEPNLRFVLEPLFASGYFREIICADNGSTDGSAQLARELGARVTECSRRGYGATCLRALDDIAARGGCEAVLFMDGDGADAPDKIYDLLAPILSGCYDFTLGERRPDLAEPGALLPQARFGNRLVSVLTRILWGFRYHDLGPFRAIRWDALRKIEMDDLNFGWTIQMQVRALNEMLRIREIPVPYRKRHGGESKVTATLKGTIMAGFKILYTVGREWSVALLTGRLPGRRALRAVQSTAAENSH